MSSMLWDGLNRKSREAVTPGMLYRNAVVSSLPSTSYSLRSLQLLAWFVHVHPILPIDIAITQEFPENKAPWLKTIMIAVSYLGNAQYVFAALILLTAVIFW